MHLTVFFFCVCVLGWRYFFVCLFYSMVTTVCSGQDSGKKHWNSPLLLSNKHNCGSHLTKEGPSCVQDIANEVFCEAESSCEPVSVCILELKSLQHLKLGCVFLRKRKREEGPGDKLVNLIIIGVNYVTQVLILQWIQRGIQDTELEKGENLEGIYYVHNFLVRKLDWS